jgi:two-component system sensor histidine kinase RegB
LLALRWAAVLGQLIAILVVSQLIGVKLPLFALLGIVSFTAVSNVGFIVACRKNPGGPCDLGVGRRGLLVGSIMTLDIMLLTLMLLLSGGPFNPFAIFYLLNVALSAVVLSRRWSWFLTALTLFCYGQLFLAYWPEVMSSDSRIRPGIAELGAGVVRVSRALYLTGAFVATAIAAMTTVYFMTRLTSELAHLDDELNRIRQQKARSERMEGLATLAAGTAHELSSPLSTIAVVAKELERHLLAVAAPADVLEDLTLIKLELARCRDILDHMAANAGESMGEPFVRIRPRDLVAGALKILRDPGPERVRVSLSDSLTDWTIQGPSRTLAQVVRGLMQNAIDATPGDQPVELSLSRRGEVLLIEVTDRGRGMSSEVLTRVGEPFFTTKEPGRGMGLGLFLARTVVTGLGGTFELRSKPDVGTTAIITLPFAPRAGG